MDAVEAIHTALNTVLTGDTGAGGLSNATGNQYVRAGFFRESHPRRTTDTPAVYINVIPTERDTEATGRHVDAIVRVAIDTHRDTEFAIQNAVEDRLITLVHGNANLTATGWTFTPPIIVRSAFLASVGDERVRHVVEFRIHCQK